MKMLHKLKGNWIYLLILVLPFLVFYWQMPFVGNLTIGNDYGAFPIQHQMELQYSLQRGSFPLYVPGFAWGQSAAALTLGQLYHPISHLAAAMPGYWQGYALEWNTFFRLVSLGLVHLLLFILLLRLNLNSIPAFFISFITVYNLRMLDLFRYGASLENYTGYLLLAVAMAFYYLKPTRFIGPAGITVATYLLICGGHPQMMYLGLLGAGLAGLIIPFAVDAIIGRKQGGKRDWKHLYKYFRTVAIFVLCGVLLASIYIVPFYMDFIQNNAQRVGQDYRWATHYAASTGGFMNNFFSPLESEVQAAFGSSSILLVIVLLPLLYAFGIRVPLVMAGIWLISLIIYLCGLGQATPVYYYFWKYFPMAKNFRIPGRMTMLFPFLFLLILAWLFRKGKQNADKESPALKSVDLPGFSALRVLTATAFVTMLFYHLVLKKILPGPNRYAPLHIAPLPVWLNGLILILGLLTLFLLFASTLPAINKNSKGRMVIGICIIAVITFQAVVQLRHGTWVIGKQKKPTLAQMNAEKQRKLRFFGDPGFGMETALVYRHKKRSAMENNIAMFYRDYLHAPNERMAYYFLTTEDSAGRVVVEKPEILNDASIKQKTDFSPPLLEDRVQMKYSSFNRVIFDVEAGAPGYFVLSYPFSKKGHWQATDNGRSTRIFKANGYRQAVFLEQGNHEVEFRYHNKALWLGVAIGILTFILLGGYFAISLLKGKKRIAFILAIVVIQVLWAAWLYSSIYNGENLNTQYTWTPADFPQKGNLAYAKPTLMLFEGYSHYAGYAVDGRVGKAAETLPKTKGWWQVNLGEIKEIGKIQVYDNKELIRRLLPVDFLGSKDGKTFKPLFTVSARGDDMPLQFSLEGKRTRFIRIQPRQKGNFALKEVEIFPYLKNTPRNFRQLMESLGGKGIEIPLWNDRATHPDEISPGLKNLGKRGVFDLSFQTGLKDSGARLVVSHLKPGKKNQRVLNLGYHLEDEKHITGSITVYLLVTAKITGVYIHKDNYLFIQDYHSKWQKETLQLHGNQWETYIISKEIRPESTKINAGIRFSPISVDNQLMIDEIKMIVIPSANRL